jgi:hypothetical protein
VKLIKIEAIASGVEHYKYNAYLNPHYIIAIERSTTEHAKVGGNCMVVASNGAGYLCTNDMEDLARAVEEELEKL